MNVPGAKRQVFFSGELVPSNLACFFDATTGEQIKTIVEIHIKLAVNSYPCAVLTHFNRNNLSHCYVEELVELVPNPRIANFRDMAANKKPKPVCPECAGTGLYHSPITAKKSPCSLGCKQP